MKVLVTGGNGFLGSVICEKLAKKHDVTILDKDNTKKSSLKFISVDISDFEKLKKKISKFDTILHFAAFSDINDSLNAPLQTVKTNILGTVNLLEICRIKKIKNFIFASSVYSSGYRGGFYGCSKKACEDYIKEYSRRSGINFLILKYGSLYGPGSDSKNGLYKIIANALKKNIVSYEGDIKSSREYIHVRDAAKSTVELFEKKLINKVVNITGHQTIKIIDLLDMIKEILQIKKKVKFLNKKLPGHYSKVPHTLDNDPALKYVTSPYVDFSQGIYDLIKQIKKDI